MIMAPGHPSHWHQRSPQEKDSNIGGDLRVTPHLKGMLESGTARKSIQTEGNMSRNMQNNRYIEFHHELFDNWTQTTAAGNTSYQLKRNPHDKDPPRWYTLPCIFERLSQMILLPPTFKRIKKETCPGACRQIDALNFRVWRYSSKHNPCTRKIHCNDVSVGPPCSLRCILTKEYLQLRKDKISPANMEDWDRRGFWCDCFVPLNSRFKYSEFTL